MSALPTVPTLLIFAAALLGLAWGLAGLVVQAVAYRGLRAEAASSVANSSHAQVRRLRLNTVLLTLITLVAALLLVSYWPG